MPGALYADMTILPFWQGDSQILEVSQDFSSSLIFLSYFNITPDFKKRWYFFQFLKNYGVSLIQKKLEILHLQLYNHHELHLTKIV